MKSQGIQNGNHAEKSEIGVVDIVVIGGGSAGVCAAVAAAREGCRVVLVEASGKLGGMGVLAKVHTFCGLYLPDTTAPPVVANPGLPEEIERRMRECTGQSGPEKMGRVYVLPQHPEELDALFRDWVAGESDRLELRLLTSCIGVTRDSERLFTVSFADGESIVCRSVVDCSADAVVAQFLGATRRMVESARLQRPAFVFSMENVGNDVFGEAFRMRLALDLVHAVRSGELPEDALGITVRNSPRKGEVFISVDMDSQEVEWHPDNEWARKLILESGRELAGELRVFLKANYSCFKHVSSIRFPETIGVRESYRWLGCYTLTGDDLLTGRQFEDVVAWATWPMEMRETAKGARFQYFEKPLPSGIPLRALMSQEVPGVYFAGRCLSATHRALASVRVMGTCFATGQAAGMAAALDVSGVIDPSIQAQMIRERLGFTKKG